ncbi:MAG: methionyl-tRNA formyltransferase [Verrucomicrobiota bacterium]|nr:methionyl-tRNA formyltransferase [Verrucomicrobiota bacterium]
MRIVFLGSAPLAAASLARLAAVCRSPHGQGETAVVGVVTQPERPQGRHLRVAASPVRAAAEAAGIPVLAPENVNAPESLDAVRALGPDLIVVAAYGQILRLALLALPPLGCINVHASLLPRYRGAAPIQWAVALGETVTGVTTMYMNERMDAGDIIFQAEAPIGPDETAGDLRDRLAREGAELLVSTLEAIRRGNATRRPQDERLATYAPMLRKEDGRINWTMPATAVHNRVRGLSPWPGCYCERGGVRLKVLKTRVESGAGQPGAVLDVAGPGPLVAVGQGAVRLVAVQPEGRRAMSGEEYLRGHDWKAGDALT